ncbi:MAG: site-specific DNA-methyltransferase [Pseudomonadota bacterium]
MPEIVFKGKEYVYNHHLTVPYRPLIAHAGKGVGPADLAGNLVIHGDNLHALKSLLPRYAGAVDLIFIDPPYNTGNEGWCYSDGVNSPIMKEWLSTNPVDGDDMLRHDKWLCMMWPRLVLLRELLSERGSLWMTLDDNEVHRARMVMDEVFGDDNFLANIVWQSKDTPGNNSEGIAQTHNHLLAYRKSPNFVGALLERNEEQVANYTNPDGDKRNAWLAAPLTRVEHRDRDYYAIKNKAGRDVWPPKGSSWRRPPEKMKWLAEDGRIWWGKDGDADFPMEKKFLSEAKAGVVNQTWWPYEFAGSTRNAGAELKELFGGEKTFDTPKPLKLLERVLELAAEADSLILDSFAGSGTTAHAVLKANARDGGTRKFILVEGEDYADTLTAERVRRAINGYAWSGTQRETLLEEKITFTQFKKANEWLAKIEALKAKEGFADGDLADQGSAAPRRFDRISVKIDDGLLRVEGERRVSERAPGLGGEFTYCTLGEPVELDKLLSGERLPAFDALGAWLFHTATGGTAAALSEGAPPWYLGEAQDQHVWLIYRPDLAFLKSPDAALTLSRARELQAWGRHHDATRGAPKRHLVFAPAKYLSNRQLQEHGVDYAPLPFALYRES